MYINRISNLGKNKGDDNTSGGHLSKTQNVLNINHTGLGNNLFEICDHLSYCWENNLDYSFPDINLLYEKIPEYPQDTIYRNLPIKRYENSKFINFRGFFYTNFHKYREKLLDIFSIDEKTLKFINNKYFNKLKNKIVVSMHVRRGDFVTITKIWNPKYINKEDYYKKAYKIMKEKLNNKDFELLIISDDPEWCKENLKFPNTQYIKNLDYIDLWIMTLCDHNILSGSTFGWWGAYLNKSFSNNIVICPRKSIFKEKKNRDFLNTKLYLQYWTIVDDVE